MTIRADIKDAEEITPLFRHSAKARHLRITVHPDARVVLTVPARTTVLAAERFFVAKLPWVRRVIARLVRRPPTLIPAPGRRAYRTHKESARRLTHDLLLKWNAHYRCVYRRVAIRCTRSRWGSCSAGGNLNFSYRLVHLPAHLSDYIVVHELCHLRELNHSSRFWKLVSETHPHHRELRQELLRYV